MQIGRRFRGESGRRRRGPGNLSARCPRLRALSGHQRKGAGWLRQILGAPLAHLVRHYCETRGRDVRLEQALQVELPDKGYQGWHLFFIFPSAVRKTLYGRRID
jgi:hypothetical protein